MKKLSDLYKPKTKAEIEESLNAKEKAEQFRKEIQAAGARCLANEEFRKYKENFERLKKLTFDQVRHYKNPDPIEYAMVISNMLSELNTLEALLTDVEMDANKKS